ncbi:flagellar motor switch protein FliN [Flaviflagellibacter deserti]|jgi:flagellar motor switch protein FliN|uniref:Flagellar motor switch protein FliN n=1 Tax=Flaviflagellibacter deserti TaxID=2267266 RepID=A0ABV9Z6G4_9HYPH
MARSSKAQRSIDEIMAEVESDTPTDVLEAVAVEATAKVSASATASTAAPEANPGPTLEESLGSIGNLDAVMRIPVTIQVVLGSAVMPVANLMKLRRGAAIPLDHRVGEPVDVVVNGRTVARGEVVVVEDDTSRFGISLTEIIGGGSTANA